MAKAKYEKWLTDDGLLLLEAWARDGLTDAEIAVKMDVNTATLYRYKQNHPTLKKALEDGKEIIDRRVEQSLLKKCLGYIVPETKAFKCKEVFYDDQGRRCEREEIKTIDVEIHIPADTTAIAIWLNNRCPERWRRNANKERIDDERLKMDQEKAKNDF